MPCRPCSSCSRPSHVSTSPSRAGLRNSMLHPDATVARLWLLHAYAKVESANVKIRPPWQISCPLSMHSRTAMRITARPGSQLTSSICMNSRLARSAAYIDWPTCAARRSGSRPTLFALEPGLALLAERHHAFDVVVREAQRRLGIALERELTV